jgi:hypothetical protein
MDWLRWRGDKADTCLGKGEGDASEGRGERGGSRKEEGPSTGVWTMKKGEERVGVVCAGALLLLLLLVLLLLLLLQ